MSFECNYALDKKSPYIVPDNKSSRDVKLPNPDHQCTSSSVFESYEVQDSEEPSIPLPAVKFHQKSSLTCRHTIEQLHTNLTLASGTEEVEITEHEGDVASVLNDLQFGIKVSLEKLPEYPERDVLMTDFSMIEVINISQQEPVMRPKFAFYVYAPVAFRFFRDLFGITTEDFQKSICDEPLYSSKSCGNSGCKFYTTGDDRFILKTVQKGEANFLINLFPGYFLNLTQHTKTLLPKYYGLFSYERGTTKIRVLIMNNILPRTVKIHEKYDIKGSTYSKRKYSGKLSMDEINRSITLKDLDLVEHWPDGFYMHHRIYEILLKSIEKDCTVLESYNIMDYSLLLGIARTDVSDSGIEVSHGKSSESFNRNKSLIGPFEARTMTGETVYLFVGIIDILQSYSWKRKVESFVKSLVYSRSSVSVTRPDLYSQRFQSFLKNSVFKCIPKLVPSSRNECCTKSVEQLYRNFY